MEKKNDKIKRRKEDKEEQEKNGVDGEKEMRCGK